LNTLHALRADGGFRCRRDRLPAGLRHGLRFLVGGLAVESVREVLGDFLLLLRLLRPVHGVRHGQAVILHGKEHAHDGEEHCGHGNRKDQQVTSAHAAVPAVQVGDLSVDLLVKIVVTAHRLGPPATLQAPV
jgi:hypothetical protein